MNVNLPIRGLPDMKRVAPQVSRVSFRAACRCDNEVSKHQDSHSPAVSPDTGKYNRGMTIIEAEKAWRKAWDHMDASTTPSNMKAEQDSWDAYVDLCNDIDQCQQPGCRETVPEYAYCPQHRPC